MEENKKSSEEDHISMLKNIAVQLYVRSDFDNTNKSAAQLADAAIERAKVLLTKLG